MIGNCSSFRISYIKKKHGIAHAKVQVIELCTLNKDGTKILFKCAKFLTLWCTLHIQNARFCILHFYTWGPHWIILGFTYLLNLAFASVQDYAHWDAPCMFKYANFNTLNCYDWSLDL